MIDMTNHFSYDNKNIKSKQLLFHRCSRCSYLWTSKITPKTCANKSCRSPYWNKERANKKNKIYFTSLTKNDLTIFRHLENLKGLAEDDNSYSFILLSYLGALDDSRNPRMVEIANNFRKKYPPVGVYE